MRTDTILLELHYFPCIQYCSKLLHYPNVLIEAGENYLKGAYRNRCHIASTNGLMRLSIPLKKGKNQQQAIRDVQIAYDSAWQNQHWRSIRTAYGNSPFFDHYAPEIQPFFQKKHKFLFDFNWAILQKIQQLLSGTNHLELKEVYQAQPKATILDFRNKIHPKKQKQVEDPLYNPPKYGQVFEEKHGFLNNLSILDLLFCTGPQASLILENANLAKIE